MPDPTLLTRLAATLGWGGTGLCLFVMLFNRYLLEIRDGPLKLPVCAGTLFALLAGSLAAGWWLPLHGLVIPAGIVALIAVGEIRRVVLRRRHRGHTPARSDRARSRLNPVTTTDLVLATYEVPLPGWRGRRFRIAHLSDFHVNPLLAAGFFEEALARVEREVPDLMFVTGDMVTHRRYIPLIHDAVRPLGRLGSFATLGNHDHWTDPATITAILQDRGLTVLSNASQRLLIDDHSLWISGFEDPWVTPPWQPPQRTEDEPLLVLCHTPDHIYKLNRAGADAVFCGHFHGGQARLPFWGSVIIPSIYGRRFDHGHFIIDNTHLFVTAGVGAGAPPLRIYCPPDVFLVDFLPTPQT